MKLTFRIALTELQTLFYSPVAWLILILFTFQTASAFTSTLVGNVRSQELNYLLGDITYNMFSSMFGFLRRVQNILYLYLPLLTMGLMSRELNSGSIKLLYSSPVKNFQIILGKYLAILLFGLLLMVIVGVYVVWASCSIAHFDLSLVLTGILGLYLIVCAYGAIGLFMSSLTSYQVVAAISTLAMLAVLNFIGRVGQSYDFVRELTYWLSIKGRADTFVEGLICSEDVLYFLIVVGLFLLLAILRLKAIRQKAGWKMSIGKYAGVVVLALILGYVSSRPATKFFYDASRTKRGTITEASQEIVRQLKGNMTITTYVNLFDPNFYSHLPVRRKYDLGKFGKFIRFKPEIKMKYVYYYAHAKQLGLMDYNPGLSEREIMEKLCLTYHLDTSRIKTLQEIEQEIDLAPEDYRVVRLVEHENGQKTFLRMFNDNEYYPSEAEISAAFKRLAMTLPTVAFLQGHGERDFDRVGDRSYRQFAMSKFFRYSLINQGFDFREVTLEQDIPEEINILVIADMRTALNKEEKVRLDAYVARGGNLFILGEPRRQEVMNPLIAPFGVQFMPGQLVQRTDQDFLPNFIVSKATPVAGQFSYYMGGGDHFQVTMPTAVEMTYETDRGFEVTPLLVTSVDTTWNELETTNFVDEVPTVNTTIGECVKEFPTLLALSKDMGGRQQKIIIAADADCIGNGEVGQRRPGLETYNYNLVMGAFHWLSDNEAPVDIRRPVPPDTRLNLKMPGAKTSRTILKWCFPLCLLGLYLFVWIRRRGR